MNRPTKKLALDAIVDCLNKDGNLRLEFMDTVFRINITRERYTV